MCSTTSIPMTPMPDSENSENVESRTASPGQSYYQRNRERLLAYQAARRADPKLYAIQLERQRAWREKNRKPKMPRPPRKRYKLKAEYTADEWEYRLKQQRDWKRRQSAKMEPAREAKRKARAERDAIKKAASEARLARIAAKKEDRRIRSKRRQDSTTPKEYRPYRSAVHNLSRRLHSMGANMAILQKLIKIQDSKCAICGMDLRGVLHIDHDHTTGLLRGLLCKYCNPALGMLKDSTDILSSASTYLQLPDSEFTYHRKRANSRNSNLRHKKPCIRRLGQKWLDIESELLSRQGGVCAICKGEPTDKHFDHNHETGMVRGILCETCNCGIGYFRDSPDLMQNAIAYLTTPPASGMIKL